LLIECARYRRPQKERPAWFDGLLQLRAQYATDEFIDPGAVPPALHVGFPEPEAAVFQHAAIESLIPHPDVPGIGAVDPDAGSGKQWLDDLSVVFLVQRSDSDVGNFRGIV
jgi:hypothetical protein